MPALPGKALQGEILGTPPWLNLDQTGPDIIGNDKGIDAIILTQTSEGFPVIGNRFGVETENLNIIGLETFAGGKIIGYMDTIETGGLHGDQKISELRVGLQDSNLQGEPAIPFGTFLWTLL